MTRRLPDDAPILTAAAMRSAEAALFATGVAPCTLMERAGRAIAAQVARLAAGRAVLLLAGPGNNGGDASVAARVLADAGHDVLLATLGTANSEAALGYHGPRCALSDASARPIVVDGLFGIGLSRPIEADVARRLAALRAGAALTIAIDVPSGFGCGDGRDMGGAGADVTLALGAMKPVHVLDKGAKASGHVSLIDIGVPVAATCRTLDRPRLHKPGRMAHKFSRGMVVIGGGKMPGAARLAARSAMNGGAGYVILATDDAGQGPDALVRRSPSEDAFGDRRVGALVIGPGLGRGPTASQRLDMALASERRLILDGDALSLLGDSVVKRTKGLTAILTPHSGEFDRMFGTGGGDKITRTVAAARDSGCTIVHKGADTVIAYPDGRAVVSSGASSWLATAGSGDVLAGLVAARVASGDARPAEAAVWLHNRAAVLAGPAFTADTLVDHLPEAMCRCL